jgi:hypothetical protein
MLALSFKPRFMMAIWQAVVASFGNLQLGFGVFSPV